MAESTLLTADTCWEFDIEKFTNEEFDAILKSDLVLYALMVPVERDDGDGHDLCGYTETLHALDEKRVRKELKGFERATLNISLKDPDYYDFFYKGLGAWTERGIRKDMLREMVQLAGMSTAKENEQLLLHRYGPGFHIVRKLEIRKEFAKRQVMRDRNITLRPWQIEALDLLEKQDDNILYIVAPKDAGKTRLGRYIEERMGGFVTTECLDKTKGEYYRQQRYLVLDLPPGSPPEDLLVEIKSKSVKVLVMSRAFNPFRDPAPAKMPVTYRFLIHGRLQ